MTKKQWLILGTGFVGAVVILCCLSHTTTHGNIYSNINVVPAPSRKEASFDFSGDMTVPPIAWIVFSAVLIGTAVLVRGGGRVRTKSEIAATDRTAAALGENDLGVWPPPPKAAE